VDGAAGDGVVAAGEAAEAGVVVEAVAILVEAVDLAVSEAVTLAVVGPVVLGRTGVRGQQSTD